MQSGWVGGEDETRALKRRSDFDDAPVLSAPTSPAKSDSITTSSSGLESHRSGRLSPVKQLQVLEDFDERSVMFYNFDDNKGEEAEDVATMRTAIRRFADGIGILRYSNEGGGWVAARMESHDRLPQLDKTRL